MFYQVDLFLVYVFYVCVVCMFGNMNQIFFGVIEKCNIDMSLFESVNIICVVISYKSIVFYIFEIQQNIFFLFGGDMGINLGVLEQRFLIDLIFELGKCVFSDINVVFFQDFGIERF